MREAGQDPKLGFRADQRRTAVKEAFGGGMRRPRVGEGGFGGDRRL
jgi:hypothetical protein